MDQLTPHPPAYHELPEAGRFWPRHGVVRTASYEKFEGVLLIRARHLPTEATLEMALGRLGPLARPALERWSALWHASVGDVEALAAETGHVEPDLRRGDWIATHRDKVTDLLGTGDSLAAALEMMNVARARSAHPVRDVSQHVLEDAVSLVGLLQAGVPLRVVVHGSERGRSICFASNPAEGGPALSRLDSPGDASVRKREREMQATVNPYWVSPAFLEAAKRGMTACRGYPQLVATLLDMASQGHAKAFLRHVIPKRGTWVVDLSGCEGFADVSARVLGVMGMAVADLFAPESPLHAVLVQEHVPFTHEHRFFVVGDRVVASTPSVRSMGLLDATPGRILSPLVARLLNPADEAGPYDRGDADPSVDRRLVAEMAWAARRMARGLGREGRFGGNYVIDMGLCERGVAAIEVNTFTNAGLYALDYVRVARALGRWYEARGSADWEPELATNMGWSLVKPPRPRASRWGMLASLAPWLLGGRVARRLSVVRDLRPAGTVTESDPMAGPTHRDGPGIEAEHVVSMLHMLLRQMEAGSGKVKGD